MLGDVEGEKDAKNERLFIIEEQKDEPNRMSLLCYKLGRAGPTPKSF